MLDSLKLQTEKYFEIIISEDGSNDDMKQFIKSYPFDNDFQHLTQEDNGWQKNKALNNAIRSAKSEQLIFIDGDCVLHQRFIEMHVRYADDKHILSGKRVKMDKETSLLFENNFTEIMNKIQKIFLKKLLFGKGKTVFIEESLFISPDGLLGFVPKIRQKAKRLIGSNMSFSKRAIYAINGFDEEFTLPAVGEDTDLAWRFQAVGYQLKSVRNLAIQYHLHHQEIWSDKSENIAQMKRNQDVNKYFCDKGLIKK